MRDWIASLPLSTPVLLGGLVAASALVVVVFKPHAAALVGDNYQFALYLIFFVGGYLIGAKHPFVLEWVGSRCRLLLAAAGLLFAAKAVLLTIALLEDVLTGEARASGGRIPAGLQPENAALFSVVEAATAWARCLAALGLSVRFLNKPGPILTALNRAVFPVYVLHFPVTIVGLAIAAQLSWSWPVEFLLLLVFVYCVTGCSGRSLIASSPRLFLWVETRIDVEVPRPLQPTRDGATTPNGSTEDAAQPSGLGTE